MYPNINFARRFMAETLSSSSLRYNRSYSEFVHYIVKDYTSHFLVPLSEKHEVNIWNFAMNEAFTQMGLLKNKARYSYSCLLFTVIVTF